MGRGRWNFLVAPVVGERYRYRQIQGTDPTVRSIKSENERINESNYHTKLTFANAQRANKIETNARSMMIGQSRDLTDLDCTFLAGGSRGHD